jgi:hypothetical protein
LLLLGLTGVPFLEGVRLRRQVGIVVPELLRIRCQTTNSVNLFSIFRCVERFLGLSEAFQSFLAFNKKGAFSLILLVSNIILERLKRAAARYSI